MSPTTQVININVQGIPEVEAILAKSVVEADRYRAERDLLRDTLYKHSRLLKLEYEALDRHLAAAGGPPSENEMRLVGSISRALGRLENHNPPTWEAEAIEELKTALNLLGESVK